MNGNIKAEKKVEYEDIFENSVKDESTENEENDSKMNTTDGNTKAKKKVEYEDIFENSGKGKDTERDEKEAKKNKTD